MDDEGRRKLEIIQSGFQRIYDLTAMTLEEKLFTGIAELPSILSVMLLAAFFISQNFQHHVEAGR